MQMISCSAVTRVLLAGLIVLAAAAPSRAVQFTLDVGINGSAVDSLSAAELGCADTGANTAHCNVSDLTVGDPLTGLKITSLDINLDNDPSVNGVVAVQNLALGTQQFTLTFTLPVAPIASATLTGGSVAGGVTENNGDTATLSTTGPTSALYTALIDGVVYQTLFPHSTTLTVVNPFDSADLTPGSFGTPIPSQPGPSVATSIGLRYDFNLTGQDAASFTGVFVVVPVPEPSTALLVVGGLAILARVGRRRQ